MEGAAGVVWVRPQVSAMALQPWHGLLETVLLFKLISYRRRRGGITNLQVMSSVATQEVDAPF
jgi:hypothetical protein